MYKNDYERYQDIPKGKKRKKQQYDCERCKNLSENEKNKLVGYREKCYKKRKTL